jgi:hypothetical protein
MKSHPSLRRIVTTLGCLVIAGLLIVIGVHWFFGVRYGTIERYVSLVLVIIDIFVVVVVAFEILELRDNSQVTHRAVGVIASSVRLLERDKVYLHLKETAQNATRYIHHLSFAQSSSEIEDEEEQNRVKELLLAFESACKKLASGTARPDVKILGPDLSAKIGGLWERHLKGCDVRVSAIVPDYDIRIQVVDGKTVVIGVGPFGRESERGFLIESFILADALNDKFMKLWERAQPLEAHAISVVMRHVELALPLPMLQKIIREALYVPSDEMGNKIIDLLVAKNQLIKDADVVYRTDMVEELRRKPTLSDEQLKAYLIEKGIDLSDSTAETFIKLVRLDTAGYTVESKASPKATDPDEGEQPKPEDAPPSKPD